MTTRTSATVIRALSWYGWVPDQRDQGNHLYAKVQAIPEKLPAKVDLRTQYPAIENQGHLGTCTANALSRGCTGVFQTQAGTVTDGPFAAVHLLLLTRDRTQRQAQCGRDAARRHQDAGRARRVSEKILAVSDQTIHQKACDRVLHASETAYHFELPAPFHHAGNARLPCGLISIRVRLHHVRKFRVGCVGKRACARRSCYMRHRLRRHGGQALHRAQFLERRLGQQGLLHDAVCVSGQRQSRQRFLDDAEIGSMRQPNRCTVVNHLAKQ